MAALKRERGGSKADHNDDAWAWAMSLFPPLPQIPNVPVSSVANPEAELTFGLSERGSGSVPSGSESEASPLEPAAADQAGGPAPVPVAPKSPPVPAEPAEEFYAGPELPHSATSEDLARDYLWVANNLGCAALFKLPPAPSALAVELWKWARKPANRTKFFEALGKHVAKKESGEDRAGVVADEKGIEKIAALIGKVAEAGKSGAVFTCVHCGRELSHVGAGETAAASVRA